MKRFFFLYFLLFLLYCGCSQPARTQSEFALGTACAVTLYDTDGKKAKETFNAVFSRLAEIENRMSANKADSELSAVNQNAGIAPAQIPADLFAVIEKSLYYAEISGGAFDPTIGALAKLWGINSEDARVPDQSEINAAIPLVNYRNVRLNKADSSVFLTESGMRLDLGGIAKGYAADEAVRIIEKNGVKRAIVNLGGNIFIHGEKPDKKRWRIGVQNPLADRETSLGFIEISGNKTLVTSGVYERFFEIDGARYHHILSAQDGYPVRNGLLSVTVVADSSIDADALSTALFVLGFEKGSTLAESLKGVEAVFIFEDKSIRGTSGVLPNFTLTDNSFLLID
jgi:thiamine biosynthesis lipoprotein